MLIVKCSFVLQVFCSLKLRQSQKHWIVHSPRCNMTACFLRLCLSDEHKHLSNSLHQVCNTRFQFRLYGPKLESGLFSQLRRILVSQAG